MDVQLIRTYYPQGVHGLLFIEGEVICKTIELPWRNNQRRISCIPEGLYVLRKRYSSKYQWHFEVAGVQGRDAILIHPANDAEKELQGCIAPVLQHTGEGKGSSSRVALQRLKARLYPVLERGGNVLLTVKKSKT